jgi:surface protein
MRFDDSRSRCVMFARLFTIAAALMVGSEAAPFTSRTDLEVAVQNCLDVDATGVTCCATADCGPAGSAEMSSWDVSQVTDMSRIFNGAGWYPTFNADLSSWDVSQVTDMNNMFNGASAFNADISSWDVSSVTDMSYMFYSNPNDYSNPGVLLASAFNQDLSSWDVSSVTNMDNMFHGSGMKSMPSWYTAGNCPIGFDGEQGQICTPCTAGTNAVSTGQCSFCLAGTSTMGATGALNCTLCPAGTSTLGAQSAATCTTCPEGTWAGNKTGSRNCVACNRAEWCTGGFSCREGHQGDACFECVKGWYMLEDVCYPCKQDAKYFFFVFLGISLFIVFIAVVVFPDKVKASWKRLRRVLTQAESRVEKMQKKALGERASNLGSVVFLVSLITFLQIQTLVVSVSVTWPSDMTAFFEALGDIVNLDAWGFINPKCSFEPSFTMSWMVRLFAPLIILLVVAGGIFFAFRNSSDDRAVDGVIRLVIQVLQVTFVGNVVHALQPLDCAEYPCYPVDYLNATGKDEYCSSDGYGGGTRRLMESNPSIVCSLDNPDWIPLLLCSVIGFFCYAAVYVVFVGYVLRKVNKLTQKHSGYDPSDADIEKHEPGDIDQEDVRFERLVRKTHPDIQRMIRRYGLLFLPYSQRTWVWELVNMTRKVLMALTAVFFTTTPARQLDLMLAQNVIWLALLVLFRPFTVVPLMGGPLERVNRDAQTVRKFQLSPGNIVEIGMACATVGLSVIGKTIGDVDSDAQMLWFFTQLGVVGALVTRGIQTAGDAEVPFFGIFGERIWNVLCDSGDSLLNLVRSRSKSSRVAAGEIRNDVRNGRG